MPRTNSSTKSASGRGVVTVVQTWKLQDAKARFSEVCRLASANGPQRITRQGKETMVILSESQLNQLAGRDKKKSLYEVLLGARGTGLVVDRDRSMARDIDL